MRLALVSSVSAIVVAASCGGPRSEAQSAAPAAPAPSPSSAVTIPPPEDGSAGESDDQLIERIPDAGKQAEPAQSQLSPPVVVRGAIARKRFHGPGERAVVLLRNPARPDSCLLPEGHPEIVMTACDFKAQGHCVSQNVSIIDGGMTSYRVRMKVLAAPPQKGARGRIELDDSAENNVHGGTIEVLVCD